MKVEIETTIEHERVVQVFPYGETNSEHCIHGIKLRWSCEDCEELIEEWKDPTFADPIKEKSRA